MGWDGMRWDRMVWDGMGWDGMRWDGMGWDGSCTYAVVYNARICVCVIDGLEKGKVKMKGEGGM